MKMVTPAGRYPGHPCKPVRFAAGMGAMRFPANRVFACLHSHAAGSLMVKRAGRHSGETQPSIHLAVNTSAEARGHKWPGKPSVAMPACCTSAFRAAASLKGKAPSRSPGQMGREAHRREHVCHRALSARRSSPAPFLEAAPAR